MLSYNMNYCNIQTITNVTESFISVILTQYVSILWELTDVNVNQDMMAMDPVAVSVSNIINKEVHYSTLANSYEISVNSFDDHYYSWLTSCWWNGRSHCLYLLLR